MNALRPHPARAVAPRRQRGYILLLVLVAMVAMMLSGIALIRSMDTNQLVAGNLAARSATLHSADIGLQSAITWLQANTANNALYNDAPVSGYYSYEADPNWSASATWATCTTCTTTAPDAAGNTVSWMIHRMCRITGSPNGVGNYCMTVAGSGATGGSMSSDAPTFTGTAAYYYRITVQVQDSRNNSTLTQAFVTM